MTCGCLFPPAVVWYGEAAELDPLWLRTEHHMWVGVIAEFLKYIKLYVAFRTYQYVYIVGIYVAFRTHQYVYTSSCRSKPCY